MTMEKVFNVAGAIVTVALVATLVQSRNTANVVKSVGGAFAGAIRAARGR